MHMPTTVTAKKVLKVIKVINRLDLRHFFW